MDAFVTFKSPRLRVLLKVMVEVCPETTVTVLISCGSYLSSTVSVMVYVPGFKLLTMILPLPSPDFQLG